MSLVAACMWNLYDCITGSQMFLRGGGVCNPRAHLPMTCNALFWRPVLYHAHKICRKYALQCIDLLVHHGVYPWLGFVALLSPFTIIRAAFGACYWVHCGGFTY